MEPPCPLNLSEIQNTPLAGSLLDHASLMFRISYFMTKTVDSINLLPNSYKEKEDVVLHRVSGKEID